MIDTFTFGLGLQGLAHLLIIVCAVKYIFFGGKNK